MPTPLISNPTACNQTAHQASLIPQARQPVRQGLRHTYRDPGGHPRLSVAAFRLHWH